MVSAGTVERLSSENLYDVADEVVEQEHNKSELSLMNAEALGAMLTTARSSVS
jgi:hypothetical protein